MQALTLGIKALVRVNDMNSTENLVDCPGEQSCLANASAFS